MRLRLCIFRVYLTGNLIFLVCCAPPTPKLPSTSATNKPVIVPVLSPPPLQTYLPPPYVGYAYLYAFTNFVFWLCSVERMEGSTTFSENRANWGGAIMNVETSSGRYADDDEEEFEIPTITFPDDTVFINNSAEVGHCFFSTSTNIKCVPAPIFIPVFHMVLFEIGNLRLSRIHT